MNFGASLYFYYDISLFTIKAFWCIFKNKQAIQNSFQPLTHIVKAELKRRLVLCAVWGSVIREHLYSREGHLEIAFFERRFNWVRHVDR